MKRKIMVCIIAALLLVSLIGASAFAVTPDGREYKGLLCP